MASSLIKGHVTLTDGTELSFAAGPRERIKAERHFKINLRDLAAQEIGEEYMVYLAYLSLVHQGTLKANVTFDQFIDENLGDYEVSDDPELAAPPAS
jgi:hypothetical protein